MKQKENYDKNIRIIIPAKDEAKNLEILLPKLKRYKVTVIDDCSTNNTAKVAKKFDAQIISNKINIGQHFSIEKALKKTKENIIILMDADNECDPKDIPQFLETLKTNDAVFGRRKRIPRFSEKFISKLSSRKGIHDIFCGYVAFRREVYNKIGYFEKQNTYGAEFKLNCVNKSFRISEINITETKRRKDSKYGNNFEADIKILKTLRVYWKKLI